MSSSTQFSNSTSCTTDSHSGTRLSATNERDFSDVPEVDRQFVENFFVALETVPNVEDDSIAQSIKAISSIHEENNMYSELVQVFNKIAQFVCATLHHCPSPTTPPLHFLCFRTKEPSRRVVPDIFVLPPLTVSQKFLQKMELKGADSSDFSIRCPWPVLESMIQVRPDKRWKNKQAVHYLKTILQHRPDKVNVLGVSCNQTGYRFYYIDACTQKASVVFSWNDGLTNLVHFIYSLQQIFAENIGRDTSMRLLDIVWKGKYNPSATWRMSFRGEEYQIQPICERKGLGRRTWIAVGTINHTDDIENAKSESDVRVMKDMWRDNSRRYKEGSLLQRIHENGFVPGVVRPIVDSAFDDLTTRNRTKHRLIMGSTGLRLSACKSVLEFLKVIYDAIESHEQVVARGVLHRDISWYNVLCRPRHYIGNENVVDHPSIEKILEEPDPQPLCLLTDFDNAALVQDDKDPGEGTKRTGTPMFMACELAYKRSGYDFLRAKPFPSVALPQFSLEGETLRNYTNIYGLERYEEYNTVLTSVISGHVAEVDPFAAGNLVPSHQPHHDMESIYWIISWFLAKALPSETEPYTGEDSDFQKAALEIIHSRMTPDHKAHSVINLLVQTEGMWKICLHPALHLLANMLFNMGDYICMCWSRFPHMPFWHSHEAFKRLLLKEIVRMSKDETPIPIQGPKPPLPRARYGFPADTGKPSLKMTAIRNLTPSGSGSQVRGSSESRQSGKMAKRARSNSISANSGSIAKKQRSNSLHGSMGNALDTDIVNDDFVSVCLENIEEDDIAWFTL